MASDRQGQNSLNGKVFGRKEGTPVVKAIFFRMRICQGKCTVTAEDLLNQTFQQLPSCLSPLSITSFESLCLISRLSVGLVDPFLSAHLCPGSPDSLFTVVTKSVSKMQI